VPPEQALALLQAMEARHEDQGRASPTGEMITSSLPRARHRCLDHVVLITS
jgi:hypothetical protein